MSMECYTIWGFWIGMMGLIASIAGLVFSIMVNAKAEKIKDVVDNKIFQLITYEHVPRVLEKLEEIRKYFRTTEDPVYLSAAFDELFLSLSMLDELKAQLSKRNKNIYSTIEEIKKVKQPTQSSEYKPAIESIRPHLHSLISQLTIEVSIHEKR